MEAKVELSSGVTVKGHEAPDSYRLAPRTEISFSNPNLHPNPNPNPNHNPNLNSNPFPNSNPNPNVNSNSSQLGAPTVTASPASLAMVVKKKRGRPKKYAPDGSLATALSPMPISASIPLTGGEFSTWKRGKARSSEAVKKQHKYDYETRGDRVAYLVGADFTPHVLTVHAGEDVTMKVMTFSQQGSRAICILSANGTISNVTLRQPTSSGGTLTYEGRFEILSLSGSFMPTDSGGRKSRSGGMSISLAGPDGRVVGGGLAGFLVAAGPVQVVVGTFLPGHQQEQKHKKQRTEIAPAVAHVNVLSVEEMRGGYGGVKPVLIPCSSFHGGNSVPINNMQAQAFRNSASDNKMSSPEDESGELELSNALHRGGRRV
ncbi:AT-hook motif nuclear-localized protein 6 [Euphorbia lathyris]|uniref:AT-hook motif nuclear-localized protein 6 n=1 Tax=Euphorbia lathyris TaxID=212925 RepID=UPI00331391CC